jgi:squalene cyclase
MSWLKSIGGSLAVVAILAVTGQQARSEEIPKEYRECIKKGLKYLVDTQNRDGHWESFGAGYPVTMTAVSGMAFLMEGSTIKEGKYSQQIRRATDWLMSRAVPSGQIGNPAIPGEMGRYMYGHGFAVLFLSSVYGEEEDGDRRRKLEDILTKAVLFIGKAQTKRGGWGYVSAADGGDFDEGSVTVTQMQAVRAARNAGISVPKEIIDKGVKYLKDSTVGGGVIYSLAGGGGGAGSHALTAAAIACGFSAGEYDNPTVKEWIKFCQGHLGGATGGINRIGHDEYTHYYFSQSVYFLADDGYKRLFPNSRESERLMWSKYRKESYANIKSAQNADGSWTGSQVGPAFATPIYLCILQLDNNVLPIYQR